MRELMQRKSLVGAISLIAALVLAGCAQPPPPPANDGYVHYRRSGAYKCTNEPVSLDGSHANITLLGRCRQVRVVGWHDDIIVYVVPGGVIDITGSRDDVIWRQIHRGPAPTLSNRGSHNEFYRNSRDPEEQNHGYFED